MPEPPRRSFAREPNRASSSTATNSALLGWHCQLLDVTALAAALCGVTLLGFRDQHHGALDGYFAFKLTIRNVLVALLCACTWGMILWSVGIYRSGELRRRAEYLIRCVIGLNSCALVVGLVLVILRSQMPAWRMMGVFWSLGLVGMAAVRGLLLLVWEQRAPSAFGSGGK